MKYDLNILNDYINRGLVECQVHPRLPLKIYNYTRECAFTRAWDEITLNMRGTVLDTDGNLIARGFEKFFNYEEHTYDEIPWNDEYVYIQDKADGSLGIIFWYENEWIVATRGSFASDQAIKAKEILLKQCDLNKFIREVVYLVEIVYPENQIVVNYDGDERLIFLTAHWRKDGTYSELNWNTALAMFNASDIHFDNIVQTDMADMTKLDEFVKKLKARNIRNKEGYVLRFYPSNFRMKVKFEEYVRLHSLMTKFSNVDIWKCLSTNTPINLEEVPDEFDAWVKKIIKELKDAYDARYKEIEDEFWTIINRKEFYFANKHRKNCHFLMKRLSSVSEAYKAEIWDEVRPKYQKPFWQKNVDSE